MPVQRYGADSGGERGGTDTLQGLGRFKLCIWVTKPLNLGEVKLSFTIRA